MRRVVSISFSLAVLISTALAAAQDLSPGKVAAEVIVAKWRNAVSAKKQAHSMIAMLASDSTQDGIPGKVEEWITTSGLYRVTTKREYDDGESVVSRQFAERRDWNGFVRELQGMELSRLRTEIFEKSVIVFGPPLQMPAIVVSQSDNKNASRVDEVKSLTPHIGS
ncbi:MAG: hypothetical protein WB421_20845 [Terriglobales bacterium]|jgi:hypothetical protein